MKKSRIREAHYHLVGWVLFLICALLFLVSGLINRDVWTVAGSSVFFLACLVFLVPLGKAAKR